MANEVAASLKTDSVRNVHINSNAAFARSKMALENKLFNVDLEQLRTFDSASNAVLPNTPSGDDLGLDLGTFGTSGFTVQTSDFGGTTVTQKARFRFHLPAEYEPGGTISLAIWCGALTTVADDVLTIDAEVHAKSEADGTHGSDLCTTGPTSCNSLTLAAKAFTITPTGLKNGDELSVRITMVGTDAGDLGIMGGLVTKIYWNLEVRS